MSTDKQEKNLQNTHQITWNDLREAAESRLEACHMQIQRLTKSIAFFRKQDDLKIPFPLEGRENLKRHQDLS